MSSFFSRYMPSGAWSQDPQVRNIDRNALKDLFSSNLTLGIFLAFLTTLLWSFHVHEPWRDEYQSWGQAAKLSGLLNSLILPGEGHPPLFYWILKLLQTVFDFEQARYFALLIGALNGLLIAIGLRKTPVLMVLFLFSYPFLYFWGIFLRSYGIGTTFILLAAWAFQKDRIWACAALLWLACFTHLYFFFLLPIFAFEEFRKSRKFRLTATLTLPCLACLYLIYLSGQGNAYGGFNAYFADWIPHLINEVFGLPSFGESGLWTAIPVAILLPFVFVHRWFGLATAATILSWVLFCACFHVSLAAHLGFAPLMMLAAILIHGGQIRIPLTAALMTMPALFGLIFVFITSYMPYGNTSKIYPAIQQAGYGDLKIMAIHDEVMTGSALKHNIKYISLPMGRETDGVVDWSNRRFDLDRAAQAYAAAGSPREFILVSMDLAPEKLPRTPKRTELTPEILCTGMKWTCEIVLHMTESVEEHVTIYKVTVGTWPAK